MGAAAALGFTPHSGWSVLVVLGLEVSGNVVETGEPVCALLAGGGHAEYVSVPRGQLFPAPPCLDLLSAAGIPETFITAYLNLGTLPPKERALIHAGASGVGLAAIRLGHPPSQPVLVSLYDIY